MTRTSSGRRVPDLSADTVTPPTGTGTGAETETEHAERLRRLDERLAASSLAGYWNPRARPAPLSPILWHWRDIHRGLIDAGEIIKLGEDAIRRVILLRDPSLPAGSTRTLTMSAQLVKPGERAPAHRHTAQAVRFMVQGSGVFTTVSGERLHMETNDLVLTPGWTWHDHTNPTAESAIWLDGLDIPLALHLDGQFQVDHPDGYQPVTEADGASRRALGSVRVVDGQRQLPRYPHYRYPWSDVRPVLDELLDSPTADDPHDGIVLDYVNPVDGGPTLPTIGCRIQVLRPGASTVARRHTSTSIMHVVEGSGTTQIDGVELGWGPRDCFSVPSWRWHRLRNASASEPAVLFSISDRPAVEALSLYREERASLER